MESVECCTVASGRLILQQDSAFIYVRLPLSQSHLLYLFPEFCTAPLGGRIGIGRQATSVRVHAPIAQQ